MDRYAVGRNIKKALNGRSQKWLADKIGAHKGTVSNWCSGKRMITAYGLLRVSRVLGETMESLMEGVDEKKSDREGC